MKARDIRVGDIINGHPVTSVDCCLVNDNEVILFGYVNASRNWGYVPRDKDLEVIS